MKVTLDLDRLLADGSITRGEYDRLLGLSSRSTAALAFNILVAFGVVAVTLYALSTRIALSYRSIVAAAAGASVFLVNFSFWIGSLWGDRRVHAADWVFAVVWALALAAAGIYAWKRDRRWLVNVVAVFGAIHFYTQWFERLGASAMTVLIGGVAALALAIGLKALNAKSARA